VEKVEVDTSFGVRFRLGLSKIHPLRGLEFGGAGRNWTKFRFHDTCLTIG